MSFQISLYLDKRRKKQGNTYPVKIRVWNNDIKKAKLYPTNFDLTETEFHKSWETEKPRNENKELRVKLNQLLAKAEKIADDLDPFTFDAFEKKLYRKTGEGENILWHYEKLINSFKKNNQLGTASTYELSRKSILQFMESKRGKQPVKISFSEISKEWLNEYESWMLAIPRSRTTVSMYVRALRAVFNSAIGEGDIDKAIYPFGKRKYQVPAARNIKKAFSKEQLKALFNSAPATPDQEKAKAFWFFSYSANGMNIKDILLLQWKHLKDDQIVFYRAKTINTAKQDLKPIQVFLSDFSRSVIAQYGSADKKPDSYIFPILNDGMSNLEKHNKIKNFTRYINQHIKKLAKHIGLPEEISTYYARHSFATNAVRSGASMEFLQESLGHGNIKTTMNYFAGFDESAKKEIAEKLMDF